jgi:hypothetical protein
MGGLLGEERRDRKIWEKLQGRWRAGRQWKGREHKGFRVTESKVPVELSGSDAGGVVMILLFPSRTRGDAEH